MSIKCTINTRTKLVCRGSSRGHIGSEKGQSSYYSRLQICDAWCIKFSGVGY